jgi:Conserved hypothetical protein 698
VPPLEIPKAAAAAPATSGSRLGEVESTFSTALIPGVALAAGIAVIAVLGEALMRRVTGGFTLPALVIALLIGMALAAPARRVAFTPGLVWCVKTLLRLAIAILGLRISLSDIIGLGPSTVVIVIGAMTLTIASSIWLSARLGLGASFGALAGAANAVCGASAALATSTVVPAYERKSADVAFAVIAANAISTLAMLIYPLIAVALGYDPKATGIFLGATILCGVGTGRQCRGDRQAVPGVPAVAGGAQHRLVARRRRRCAHRRRESAGADVRHHVPGALYRQHRGNRDAGACAGLCPGEGRPRRRRDLGLTARHRRARRRHQHRGAALHQLAPWRGVRRRNGNDPAYSRGWAAGDGALIRVSWLAVYSGVYARSYSQAARQRPDCGTLPALGWRRCGAM